MNKRLLIDIETTGLDCTKDSITELACIYMENKKIVKRAFYKEDIYNNFLGFLDSVCDKYDKYDKIYFIAYNAKFDNEFIRKLFTDNKNDYIGSYFYNPYVCVMQLVAYKSMIKRIRFDDFKLSTVCKYFKIPVKEKSLHGADYDIEITRKLYNKLSKW